MGFVSTLLATGLGAHWQARSARGARVFEARVAAYSELAAALYEYERATYNRKKTGLDPTSTAPREHLRKTTRLKDRSHP